MYFRNKFDEEFLFLANNISPKGGRVRLDNKNPRYFIFEKPAYDEGGRYVVVKPLLLYNEILTDNKKDKIIEDWIVLCQNKKDTEIRCRYNPNHYSQQNEDFVCNLNFININGDLVDDLMKTDIYYDNIEHYDPDEDYDEAVEYIYDDYWNDVRGSDEDDD